MRIAFGIPGPSTRDLQLTTSQASLNTISTEIRNPCDREASSWGFAPAKLGPALAGFSSPPAFASSQAKA